MVNTMDTYNGYVFTISEAIHYSSEITLMHSDTELIRNVVLDQLRIHSMKVIALVKGLQFT